MDHIKNSFSMKYTLKVEAGRIHGYNINDIKNDKQFLCDSLITITVVKEKDHRFYFMNNFTGSKDNKMSDDDLFEALGVFAKSLSTSDTLSLLKKQILQTLSDLSPKGRK